jgi:predicted transcriptional regulator of viral defense system
MKYKKAFGEFFSKFPLFNFNDARLFLIKNGASEIYTRKFLSLMIKSGMIYRLTKGKYTMHRNSDIIGFAFQPFYYGLGSALNYHDVTEQQYNTTIITPRNIRSGTRVIFGLNSVIYHIPKELFFGYDRIKTSNFYVYISDMEKTLVDMVYFRLVPEDYVYENIAKKIDPSRLKEYLKNYKDPVKEEVYRILQKYKRKQKSQSPSIQITQANKAGLQFI